MKRGSDGYGARRDRSWGPKILLFDNGSPAISRQERRIRRSCEGRLVWESLGNKHRSLPGPSQLGASPASLVSSGDPVGLSASWLLEARRYFEITKWCGMRLGKSSLGDTRMR